MYKELYTPADAAEHLAVGVERIKEWLSMGDLKGTTINGVLYITREEMEHFIANHSRTTNAGTGGEYRPGY